MNHTDEVNSGAGMAGLTAIAEFQEVAVCAASFDEARAPGTRRVAYPAVAVFRRNLKRPMEVS